MIQIECSSCKKLLGIDDAFAGSVCRCQYCGTIQTVPKAGGNSTNASGDDSPKALFKRKARIESALSPFNDDLDRAADEMDSAASLSPNAIYSSPSRKSGSAFGDELGSSGTVAQSSRQSRQRANPPSAGAVATARPKEAPVATSYVPRPSRSAGAVRAQPRPARRRMLLVGIALGVISLAAIAAFYLSRGTSRPADVTSSASLLDQSSGSVANVCGLPLTGGTVVYILDRSGITQQAFADMSSACFNSVASLGASRKFQILVWNAHQEMAYPPDRPLEASASQVASARAAIVDTYAGSTDLSAHLTLAVANGATDIVILSAVDADENMADEIRQALGGKSIRVHAVAVGMDLRGMWMRRSTEEFRGGFKQVPLGTVN